MHPRRQLLSTEETNESYFREIYKSHFIKIPRYHLYKKNLLVIKKDNGKFSQIKKNGTDNIQTVEIIL